MASIETFDEINRQRALTEEESDMLFRKIRHGPPQGTYRRWTHKDNAELLKAARKRGGVKDYAERTGRTYASVNSQLRDLKNQRRRRGIAFVGRFFYDGEIGGE